MKVNKNKERSSKERKHKRMLADTRNAPLKPSNLNKRQKLNQNKLYQRRSVTTTRGIDISPQIKNSMKSDIQRPTSSSGVENYIRNNAFKDCFKNDNLLLRSNPLDLYDFKENSGKRNKFRNNSAMGTSIKTNKKAFSFVANTKKPRKQAMSTHPGKRNSSRRSNGYSKKSHSFSMTKKFKGLQKIFIKDPSSRVRYHNQTPNNQISAMMSIQPASSLKNNNNITMFPNNSILHHASCRRKPIKSSKIENSQYYEQEKDKFWQWDLLANTSSSRGKRSSILDLSGIIPISGNRTTLLKKNSVNVPNYRSTSKNKF